MADIVVIKNTEGKLEGCGEKGSRAYAKFVRTLAEMTPGDTAIFSFKLPRSPGEHRGFFRLVRALFERQEQFEDEARLRAWLTVGAGYCDMLPGPNGRMVAMPQSIAFDKLDEVEFVELKRQVRDFLWQPRAHSFLWPHLSDKQAYTMVDHLMLELG